MVESLFLILWLFFLANLILVIWALIDAIKVPDESMYKAGSKLIWVLVILGGFVGAIVYLAVGRPSSAGRVHGGRPAVDPAMPPPPGTHP